MTDKIKDAHSPQTDTSQEEAAAASPPPPQPKTLSAEKPHSLEPHSLSRRGLITTVPKATLGTWLALKENQGLAFHPGFFMKGRGQPTAGTLWAFGSNSDGQLGRENITGISSPVQVGSLSSWVDVGAGYRYSLARSSDGTLLAFGNNYWGQLGLGNGSIPLSPAQVGTLSSWTQVAAGDYHSLAQRSDGTLWAFGGNFNGALGVGDTLHRSTPVQVGTLSSWAEVAVGDYHSFARSSDGTLWACYVNRQPKKNKYPDPTFLDCCSFLIAA